MKSLPGILLGLCLLAAFPTISRCADKKEVLTLSFFRGNGQLDTWKPWGNRTYKETKKFKDKFPVRYGILAEMDPQILHGKVQPLEFYDLQADPDEMKKLDADPE